MTDRNATAAVVTEIEKPRNTRVHLVRFIFDDETLGITDGYRDIEWDGITFIREGYLLGIGDIEETAKLQGAQVNIALSGVDQAYISAFLSKNYLNRQVVIHKAFLTNDLDFVDEPILWFSGRMDGPKIDDDPTDAKKSVVTVAVTNDWYDFNRIAGRRCNDEEQQLHFPGDKFFEFTARDVSDLVWGRADEA